MDQTKSEEHGIIRNSVNDNVNKQLYQYYRFVISLEETNSQSVNSEPLTLQKLSFYILVSMIGSFNVNHHFVVSPSFTMFSVVPSISVEEPQPLPFTILQVSRECVMQTNHGNREYRDLSLSLLEDINRFILKQAWEWAVNGRLLDIHAEFFVEIVLPAGALKADGSRNMSLYLNSSLF